MKRLLIFCGAVALAATPAAGQRASAPETEITSLQAEYRDEQVRARRLRSDAVEAAEELADLERQLAGLRRDQNADDLQLAVQRARLDQLNRREAELVSILSRARAKQGRFLSALQMMTREPPPPLLIPADRAVDTVRASILIKAMAPDLERQAQALVLQQSEVARVRRLAVLSSERLMTTDSAQSDRRSEIEQLTRRKTALGAVLRADAERSERAARTLEARIRALGGRPAVLAETGDLTSVATRLPGGRSRLTPPMEGQSVRSPNGVTWRGTGQVINAPAEAGVDYAGPLSGWGQVVILDLGPGWRAVITGLDTVSVEAGSRVADGQALGRSLEDGEVYFELRRADRPIDPRPWLD